MPTTFKLYTAAASDGAAYIDLPVSGRITSLTFTALLVAGAGGVGQLNVELSRQAVNQVATNNPRGVIGHMAIATAAASQGTHASSTQFPNEPVKSGERLYLNTAYVSNFSAGNITALITIS